MRVVMYPFFGVQDKLAKKFKVNGDSVLKFYLYAGRQMLKAGWEAALVLPAKDQLLETVDWPGEVLEIPYTLELDNLSRRFQWDPAWIKSLRADALLLQHEFLPVPLRHLGFTGKIFLELGFLPESAGPPMEYMFKLALKGVDLVHCNSQEIVQRVESLGGRAVHWEPAYDERLVSSRELPRDVDVLFNARCSANGYTNHKEFFASMTGSPLHVVVTDQTNYARASGLNSAWLGAAPPTREEYESLLHRSRVVMGLVDNGYGGFALREAVACGAVPVVLRTPAHEDLVTSDWPYFCTIDNVRRVVEKAVKYGWGLVSNTIVHAINKKLKECTYAHVWKELERAIRA